MLAARIWGFEPDEKETILRGLVSAGWRVDEGAGEPAVPLVDRCVRLATPALVVVAVRDPVAARDLRRCTALAPQHLYVAAVACGAERGVLATIAPEVAGRIIFLPLRVEDDTRLFRRCRALARASETRQHLAHGLRRQVLSIEIETADVHVAELAWYLTDRLCDAGFATGDEPRRRMELALEEALVNAVEHGNLELESELRSEAGSQEDRYETLRRERMADPRYATRKVRVQLEADPVWATVEVSDEGQGIADRRGRGPDPEYPAGRGIALMRRAFETVEHERSTLRLRCRKEQRHGT